MATTAELLIRLRGDTQNMERAMRRGNNALTQFQRTVKTVAATLGVAFGARQLLRGLKSTVDSMDDLAKTAQRVGVSVEALSGLKYAGDLADVSMEQLATGMGQLAKNAFDMSRGTGEAKEAFKALGMQVVDAKGNLKSNEALLRETADRLSKLEDGTLKTALSMKLFGRSGRQFIPLLNQTATGLRSSYEEAERWGLIVSTRTAKNAEHFNDNLTRLRSMLKGFSYGVIETALPALNQLTDAFLSGSNGAKQFGMTLGQFLVESFADVLWLATQVGSRLDQVVKFGDITQKLLRFMATDEDKRTVGQGLDIIQGIADLERMDKQKQEILAKIEKIRNASIYDAMNQGLEKAADNAVQLSTGLARVAEAIKTINIESEFDFLADVEERALEATRSQEVAIADLRRQLAGATKEQQALHDVSVGLYSQAPAWVRAWHVENARLIDTLEAQVSLQRQLEAAAASIENYVRGTGPSPFDQEPVRAWEQAAIQAARNIQTALAAAFTEPFKQGEFSIRAWAQSLLSALADIAAQLAASMILKSILGSFVSPATLAQMGLAEGGVVTRPTLAVVGEAGPEAVIPLREAGGFIGEAQPISIRNINLFDGQFIGDYLATPSGERVVLNVIAKNRRALGFRH